MPSLPRKKIPPLGPGRASPRTRVLAEWRGIDLWPLEKARVASAKPALRVVPDILKNLRIEARQAEAEIAKVWSHLIDPTICAHAHPTGLRKGTLFVQVDSNTWLSEIVRYRRREILERLQHSFGRELIQRISFRVG